NHFASLNLDKGKYTLEFSTAIKTYIQVDSAITLEADDETMKIDFGSSTDITIGSRSRHEHPEATITTTKDPADIMEAVSYLGSAMKTFSPERSYPTLRGHPPLIEFGDELNVPDSLSKPETEITIEIPATLKHIFVSAPLSFYLGATLTKGETPKIKTSNGFEYALADITDFETSVAQILKQVFFLDCVTRTEGLYQVDLEERNKIESKVDLDFDALYQQSPAKRLESYLTVDFETIRPHLPEWELTTHLAPEYDNLEILPFVINDLAIIRSPAAEDETTKSEQAKAVEEFVRDDAFTRSAGETTTGTVTSIQPTETESIDQAWIGDGAPIGASKPTKTAFTNRLERTKAEGDIDITVICNDTQMEEERDIVAETYGDRENLPFDITMYHEVSTQGLRTLLQEPTDFLHYIGHIDDDGFECVDGKLDTNTLDSVAIDAFFLNACQSYSQGMNLIESGSIAGVVTLSEVLNSGAVEVGSTFARLLNRGFPFRTALNIAKEESIVGHQYSVVGDGNLSLTQPESG
ncbi:MAG: hypothetical protein ABEI06_01520, partial [Halobacteriaceae archaeon]